MQVLPRHVRAPASSRLRAAGPRRWGGGARADWAPEATARAFSSPPLHLREFFFEESVGRVVHERLRALVPALGGVYGLAGARGPPQAKHARGGAAGSRRRDRPARQAAHVCKRSYHGWHARWGRFRAPTASPSRPFGPATRVVVFWLCSLRARAPARAQYFAGRTFFFRCFCT